MLGWILIGIEIYVLKRYFINHGGYSSVGRASDCGSECHGFEPRYSPLLKE